MNRQIQDENFDRTQTEAVHELGESNKSGATETAETKKQDGSDPIGNGNAVIAGTEERCNTDNNNEDEFVTLTGNESDEELILLYEHQRINMRLPGLRKKVQDAFHYARGFDVPLDIILRAFLEAYVLNPRHRRTGKDPLRCDETRFGPFSGYALEFPL